MKFTLPLLALAATTLALESTPVKREPTLVGRDLATITGAINQIGTDVDALNSAVNSYSGGAGEDVIAANNKVLSEIKEATSQVAGTSDISLTDSLTLQSAVQTLTTKVETVVNSIISKKPEFTSSGVAGTVLQGLQDQYDASAQLAKTISSKVPTALQSLATTLSAGITDNLQKGVTAYKGSTNSAGGASGGSSSSAAAAPAQSSSAAMSVMSSAAPATLSSSVAAPTYYSSSVAAPAASSSSVAVSPAGNGTSAPPAQFTGAASTNGFSFGALAMAAAAMML